MLGHTAIRFARQRGNERTLETYAEVPLGQIVSCEAKYAPRPLQNPKAGIQAGQHSLADVKGIRDGDEPNFIVLSFSDARRTMDMYCHNVRLELITRFASLVDVYKETYCHQDTERTSPDLRAPSRRSINR